MGRKLYYYSVCISLLLTAEAARAGEWHQVTTPTRQAAHQFGTKALAPEPTKPPAWRPQDLRKRSGPTCGFFSSDGSPNVCDSTQYCTTIATGSYGVFNCCNPDNCYLGDSCPDCNGYACVTSYMSAKGTLYSRWGCDYEASTVYLYYNFGDTPAYTSSIRAEEAAASSSQAAAAASSRSKAAQQSAASESAYEASLSAASASRSLAALQSELSAAKASSSFLSSTTPTSTSTSTPSPPSARSDTAVGAATASTGTPTSTSLTQKIENGLKGGAIAGITVGAIVGAAVIGVVLFIIYRVRKKRKEDRDDVPVMTGTTYMGPPK